jgi:hypothetical protein
MREARVFGSGPTEDIQVEAKLAREKPLDEHASQARYDEQLDHELAVPDEGHSPGLWERLSKWLSAHF